MNDQPWITERLAQAPPLGAPAPGTVILNDSKGEILDEGAATDLFAAYFGSDDTQMAVRVVASGDTLGYLSRTQALDLIELSSRGLGESIAQFLPGMSTYAPISLRCPIGGCPANPIVAATFDVMYPPRCPEHPSQPLEFVRS
jgi:hypothetical protein